MVDSAWGGADHTSGVGAKAIRRKSAWGLTGSLLETSQPSEKGGAGIESKARMKDGREEEKMPRGH